MKTPSFEPHVACLPKSKESELSVRIAGKEDKARVQRLLSKRHYLGNTPPVGDFLIQIVSRGRKWLALLVWGAAALRLQDRDQWIGWS
jgi:hypothetical protein